jgi:hypothetical protein
MLLWFLARDEARATGWQSGLVSAGGKRKPSYAEFQTLAAAGRKRQLTLIRRVRTQHIDSIRELLGGVLNAKLGFGGWLPVGALG